MNGADILVERLFHHGVRTIFGMPGSHSTALYDAIHRHGQLQTILVRNEQAGAFMADGYARVTGQPGVICTTAGPGATNALTGVAEAWADSIPLLLLAGQVNHDRLHEECGNYHEIDLEAIFKPCTKFHGTVMACEQIGPMVDRALAALTTGRRRPAALFLPQDLAAAEIAVVPASDAPVLITNAGVSGESEVTPTELATLADVLLSFERPIVLAGGGAVAADAGPELYRLVQKLDCPLVTTLNGKGIVDERDRYALGHARSVRGLAALGEADGMLAIGCRFTEVMTGFRTLKVPRRLVQIDVDKSQIGMNHPVEASIVANARAALRALNDLLPDGRVSGWGARWDNARATVVSQPEWIIETLRAELPDNAVLFTDASEVAYRMHTDFAAYAPRTFFYPSNYIALGWALPAAVGAAVALPDRPVFSFSGDGGFLMTSQELVTANRYRLNLIAIVHNDEAYGAIKNLQKNRHGGRYLDTDLNNPGFCRYADALNVIGMRGDDPPALARALRIALQFGGPMLIEIADEWRDHRA